MGFHDASMKDLWDCNGLSCALTCLHVLSCAFMDSHRNLHDTLIKDVWFDERS